MAGASALPIVAVPQIGTARPWAAPQAPALPGGGGEVRRPPRRSDPVGGGAAVPRRLCPLLYRQPPTAVWGPSPLPGLHPSPKEDPGPWPRAGAPSWAVGV